jgi:hypothetical protein
MEIHPVQYIYEAVGTKIVAMEDKDPETKLLKKMICQTGNNRFFDKLRLFKVWRRDEIASFTPFESMKNRQLLFHGTTMNNYLSILS